MPSEHRTRDRHGRPVTLHGVVTHVAGRRVAFEYRHPERGLWHVWVADHTCFPVNDAGLDDGAATASSAATSTATGSAPTGPGTTEDGGPRGVRTHNLRIKSPQLCQLS